MPYKRTGAAIAHYLDLFREIAKKYGNPFVIAYLPEPVDVGGKNYSRESIKRYVSWVKKFYREKGRKPPIRIEYIKDRVRGRVSAIFVELDKIDTEIEWLKKDETPWPYRGRGGLYKKVERLKKRVEELRSVLAKYQKWLAECEDRLTNCAENPPIDMKTVENMKKELDDMKKRYITLKRMYQKTLDILTDLVSLTPTDVLNCVDVKPNTPVCNIVRIILDRAITYVDDITPLDIVMSEIDAEYAEKIERITEKLKKQLEQMQHLLLH